MPDDLNNKMDEMLRKYARRGRQQPENPIHPATRRMLQGEVERVHRGKREEETRAGFRSYWQLVVLGGTVCLVLAAMLWPEEKPVEMAAVEEARPAPVMRSADAPEAAMDSAQPAREADEVRDLQTMDLAAEPPPRTTAGSEVKFRRELAKSIPANRSEALPPAAAGLPKAPQTEAEAALTTGEMYDRVGVAAPAAPTLTPRQSASPRPEAVSKAASLTNLGAAIRSRFVRVTNQAGQGPAHVFLTNFQVEVLGEELRVIDADGSVYVGRIAEDGPPREGDALADGASAGADVQRTERESDFVANYFEAKGPNITLGKEVVMTGTLLERTNTASEPMLNITFERRAEVQRQEVATVAPKKRIVGKVVVGGTNEVAVEAISTGP